MSTTALRRTFVVLLATLLAAVAYQAVHARAARADVRPSRPAGAASSPDQGKSHRPVVGSGVKFVRNADGSVTQTR